MMLKQLLFYGTLAWLPTLETGCQKNNKSDAEMAAGPEPVSVPVASSIKEASGIADSKTHPNSLWTIEDSGNKPELILLGHDGSLKKRIPLKGATNWDWEDMALAQGHVYIGDIGDNGETNTDYRIYRFEEPGQDITEITSFQTIRFRYPDKSHDAEAFLVDPETNDILLITKRDAHSQVYKLSYPYSFTNVNTLVAVCQLSFTGTVSAALAPTGSEVLVKTYDSLYCYKRLNKESLPNILQHRPTKAAYLKEPQGEAVTYKQDGSGYFTLSEQFLFMPVYLYFYKNSR